MTQDYADQRRAYVAKVRRSFDTEAAGEEYGSGSTEETTMSFSFFKIRVFIAGILLAAFFAVKFSDAEILGFQSKDFIDIISDNHYYTNLQDYVMIHMQDAPETEQKTAYDLLQ
ncbi:MAG: hypothetical protein ACI4AD_09865 [Roseburia sp.]